MKHTAAAADQLETIRLQNSVEPFDIDFRTVGEFYHKIETAFYRIPAERLFIGDPAAQANPQYLDLPKELVRVVDADSACRAIEMIIEQGESPPRRNIPTRTSSSSTGSGANTRSCARRPRRRGASSSRFVR